MKRKLLIWAVLLLLVLVVGCDGKKGGLSVKVYEGETSEFLKVNLKLTIGGKTASTSSGQYTFTQVPVGTHTLTVEAAGYFEKNQEVTIEAGKVVDCEVRLVKNYIAEVKVPGGINPIGLNDNYLIIPIDSFCIAKYEISWQAWKEVYDWATDDARLGRKYYFENEGKMGEVFSGGTPITTDENHPVTHISWYDAIVWCNALTEYYNHFQGENLECVYKSSGGSVHRSSQAAFVPQLETVNPDPDAKGFRLPSSNEWERAARYRDGSNWLDGNHASGDPTKPCWTESGQGLSTLYGDYAWHEGNSEGHTHPVGKKKENDLGIYDMSGNVSEWCFDKDGDDRVTHGGSGKLGNRWLQIGLQISCAPEYTYNDLGLRPVRTK